MKRVVSPSIKIDVLPDFAKQTSLIAGEPNILPPHGSL